MFSIFKKNGTLLGAAAATLIAAGGVAIKPVQAATLLDISSQTVSSGWLTTQSFDYTFNVATPLSFTNLTLALFNGDQRITLPIVGSTSLPGALFSSATLSGLDNGYSSTLSGPQSLALGDYVNTFAGSITPGAYSLQLNFLRAPLVPTDFKGSLSATVVPGAAEWMMMLAGLGAVGYAARRRAKGNANAPQPIMA